MPARLIVLDTNFVLFPFESHIDIVEECKRALDEPFVLAIIDLCVTELKDMNASGNTRRRRHAALALTWLRHHNVRTLPTKGFVSADAAILGVVKAYKGPIAVATQDRDLKRKLKEAGIPRIIIRQKKYLQLII